MISYVISGRLTADAEAKTTQNGLSFEKFSIAVNISKEKAKYYNCSWFGQSASKMHVYLTKGMPVTVMGTPRWFIGSDGREIESVTVNALEITGSKPMSEKTDNDYCKPYEMDGKQFPTREELEAYKEQVFSKGSPDGMNGPETFEDIDIPF